MPSRYIILNNGEDTTCNLHQRSSNGSHFALNEKIEIGFMKQQMYPEAEETVRDRKPLREK